MQVLVDIVIDNIKQSPEHVTGTKSMCFTPSNSLNPVLRQVIVLPCLRSQFINSISRIQTQVK